MIAALVIIGVAVLLGACFWNSGDLSQMEEAEKSKDESLTGES